MGFKMNPTDLAQAWVDHRKNKAPNTLTVQQAALFNKACVNLVMNRPAEDQDEKIAEEALIALNAIPNAVNPVNALGVESSPLIVYGVRLAFLQSLYEYRDSAIISRTVTGLFHLCEQTKGYKVDDVIESVLLRGHAFEEAPLIDKTIRWSGMVIRKVLKDAGLQGLNMPANKIEEVYKYKPWSYIFFKVQDVLQRHYMNKPLQGMSANQILDGGDNEIDEGAFKARIKTADFILRSVIE